MTHVAHIHEKPVATTIVCQWEYVQLVIFVHFYSHAHAHADFDNVHVSESSNVGLAMHMVDELLTLDLDINIPQHSETMLSRHKASS